MPTLLAIGDMHLGRLPAALPDDLYARRSELGPEAAWQAAVERAVSEGVDAVVLAGDLVERSRDFFVAYGALKSGIERLASAGIETIAVAGNHDVEVLPNLADEIDALHLLGRDGQWQRHDLEGLGLVGWSFPQAQVRTSPLSSLETERGAAPLIGLVHCDRDQPDSVYAPVTSDQLAAAPVDAWLLGHIHQPDALDGDRPTGYLGSLSALRASETGPRGPWRIRVDRGRVRARHLPDAPLRYEAVDIDCGGLDEPHRLNERILQTARELGGELSGLERPPAAVGLRVRLTGETPLSDRVPALAGELTAEARSWREHGIDWFVHRIEVATLPAPGLQKLARQSDPCGLLAQRLLALEEPESEEARRLVRAAREQLEPVDRAREFRDVRTGLDDAEVIDLLRQAGRIALARLLAQQDGTKG